jgi:hypothetical protein
MGIRVAPGVLASHSSWLVEELAADASSSVVRARPGRYVSPKGDYRTDQVVLPRRDAQHGCTLS